MGSLHADFATTLATWYKANALVFFVKGFDPAVFLGGNFNSLATSATLLLECILGDWSLMSHTTLGGAVVDHYALISP